MFSKFIHEIHAYSGDMVAGMLATITPDIF